MFGTKIKIDFELDFLELFGSEFGLFSVEEGRPGFGRCSSCNYI